jgi:hypothetical protein
MGTCKSRTATGSGLGSETAVGFKTKRLRTATGSGVGSESATGVRVGVAVATVRVWYRVSVRECSSRKNRYG